MNRNSKIYIPLLFSLFSCGIYCCDCRDDDEIRRLEREKQSEISLDSTQVSGQ